MRIRSIKPEFWRSQDVADLPREVRLLWIGLWSYVDDNGVGLDDYRAVAADLFAFDDPVEAREFVRDGLATLSRGARITRYTVAGRSYLAINGWDEHQRIDKPNKARFPEPSEADTFVSSENDDTRETLATPSRESREGLAPGTGEQGNRGTGEERSLSSASPRSTPQPHQREPDRFGEFYDAFPRHKDRKAAAKAFTAAIKTGVDADTLIAGAHRYRAEVASKDPQYIKHPKTWLNQGCWHDEPDPPPRPHPTLSTADQRVLEAQRLKHNPPSDGGFGQLRVIEA